MAYQVLARKWRPQSFDDVLGQQAVTRTLKNALKSGRYRFGLSLDSKLDRERSR